MTAVEKIIEYCEKAKNPDLYSRRVVYDNIIRFCEEQAKEMEKEQIKDAYYKGGDDLTKMHFIEPEEYYKETFKSE